MLKCIRRRTFEPLTNPTKKLSDTMNRYTFAFIYYSPLLIVICVCILFAIFQPVCTQPYSDFCHYAWPLNERYISTLKSLAVSDRRINRVVSVFSINALILTTFSAIRIIFQVLALKRPAVKRLYFARKNNKELAQGAIFCAMMPLFFFYIQDFSIDKHRYSWSIHGPISLPLIEASLMMYFLAWTATELICAIIGILFVQASTRDTKRSNVAE